MPDRGLSYRRPRVGDFFNELKLEMLTDVDVMLRSVGGFEDGLAGPLAYHGCRWVPVTARPDTRLRYVYNELLPSDQETVAHPAARYKARKTFISA